MKRVKSTVSKAASYMGMGEYWDKHDLADSWESTEKMDFKFISEPQDAVGRKTVNSELARPISNPS